MPFVFTPSPRFTYPVKVMMPTESGVVEMEFDGRFVLDPDENFLSASQADTAGERRDREISALMDVFVGWADGHIKREDDTDLPVTEETIRNLLAQTPVRIAVYSAYLDATRYGGQRLGNSVPSPVVSGRAARPKKKTKPRH